MAALEAELALMGAGAMSPSAPRLILGVVSGVVGADELLPVGERGFPGGGLPFVAGGNKTLEAGATAAGVGISTGLGTGTGGAPSKGGTLSLLEEEDALLATGPSNGWNAGEPPVPYFHPSISPSRTTAVEAPVPDVLNTSVPLVARE